MNPNSFQLKSVIGVGMFWLAAVFCLSPWCTPPVALTLGIALALLFGNPYPSQTKKFSRSLLQACVVLLGFSMDFRQVIAAGREGIVFAMVSITVVLTLGMLLGRWLRMSGNSSLLVSAGTAICGGSAIAAVGSVVRAKDEEMSVAVGTVFLLNAVALYIFPPIGHALHMSGTQFGTWSGIAIHDVSSVVGAAAVFGDGALQVATAVKLSRVLYIIPVCLTVPLLFKKGSEEEAKQKLAIPWFIGLFLIASLLRTYVSFVADNQDAIKLVATHGLALALFLIGGGITVQTLKQVGPRPLIQGVVLWLVIGLGSLAVVVR